MVLLVLVGLERGGGGLEGSQLGLVTEGVKELPNGRQQSCAVGLQLLVLLAETELYSEPVDLQAEMLPSYRIANNTSIPLDTVKAKYGMRNGRVMGVKFPFTLLVVRRAEK